MKSLIKVPLTIDGETSADKLSDHLKFEQDCVSHEGK
jgi:hypothetical protein